MQLLITRSFTNKCAYVDSLKYDDSRWYSRILLGTTGCIGAGLDCDDIRLVIRNGLPTSLINFIQEMGRCGRNRSCIEQNNTPSDHCVIVFNLGDFTFLEERLFIKLKGNDILSDDDRIAQQRKELYKVLCFVTL